MKQNETNKDTNKNVIPENAKEEADEYQNDKDFALAVVDNYLEDDEDK